MADIGKVIRFSGKGKDLTVQTIDDGVLTIVTLYEEKEKKAVGRVILLTTYEQAIPIILDICIYNEKDRRKGNATYLLNMLKEAFEEIHSQAMSKAGRELLLKNGFELRPALKKKDEAVFVWKKERKS